MVQRLHDIFEILLSLILPKDPGTLLLEDMGSEEIITKIPKANILGSGKYRALFQYKNQTARLAVWEIKYRENRKIAKVFSQLLYEFILEEVADEMSFSNFHNPLLIPIPASNMRVRERGYNQCELIVKEIEKLDDGENFEINYDALRKIKETPHQSKLKNKEKRLKNLKGCFSAEKNIVEGRYIILVDDVITTGRTMDEAAKTLREAGAKKVIGFAIAH